MHFAKLAPSSRVRLPWVPAKKAAAFFQELVLHLELARPLLEPPQLDRLVARRRGRVAQLALPLEHPVVDGLGVEPELLAALDYRPVGGNEIVRRFPAELGDVLGGGGPVSCLPAPSLETIRIRLIGDVHLRLPVR